MALETNPDIQSAKAENNNKIIAPTPRCPLSLTAIRGKPCQQRSAGVKYEPPPKEKQPNNRSRSTKVYLQKAKI